MLSLSGLFVMQDHDGDHARAHEPTACGSIQPRTLRHPRIPALHASFPVPAPASQPSQLPLTWLIWQAAPWLCCIQEVCHVSLSTKETRVLDVCGIVYPVWLRDNRHFVFILRPKEQSSILCFMKVWCFISYFIWLNSTVFNAISVNVEMLFNACWRLCSANCSFGQYTFMSHNTGLNGCLDNGLQGDCYPSL